MISFFPIWFNIIKDIIVVTYSPFLLSYVVAHVTDFIDITHITNVPYALPTPPYIETTFLMP